jgi:hypothetical protein
MIDCVSCHTASSSRIWAEKNAGQSAPSGDVSAFTSTWNIALTKSPSTERSDNLHAFGYLGADVSINQRTANESAVVADTVNAELLSP